MSKRNKLTPKQRIFCKEYLIDLKATPAAARAGYKYPAYGRQLRTKTHVLEYIEELLLKREKKSGKTGDDVIEELIKIGFANITQYSEITTKLIHLGKRKVGGKMQDVYGNRQFIRLKDTDEWTETAAVQELSQNKDGTLKIKLYDKKSALTDLGKHFGLIKDLHEHTGKDGGPIETTTKVIIGLPGKNPLNPHPEEKPPTNKKE